jgi:polyphenol oxidase
VFAYRDADGPVEIAFTDRHRGIGGGPSAPPLDLSSRALEGGSPAAGGNGDLQLVTRALSRPPIRSLIRSLIPAEGDGHGPDRDGHPRHRAGGGAVGDGDPSAVLMHQVHGSDVVVVDEATLRCADVPVADALVTRLPGVVLVVRIADCVPVLLADPEAGLVAAVHAGRPGLVAGVVPAAVRVMRDGGASRIRAWLGPHVCGGCYEVPAAMRDDVCAVVPQAWSETSWGTPSVDIGAGVLAQLREDDVQVQEIARCTVEDDDLFSYRRQGTGSGRLGGLIWMRP